MNKYLRYGIVAFVLLTTTQFVFAKEGGTSVGGGGSECESRIAKIRDDIREWILHDGAKTVDMGQRASYRSYVSKMSKILVAPPKPRAVVIACVSSQQEQEEKEKTNPDQERLVEIDDVSKTCRGFRSQKDKKLHILCNRERFEETTDEGKYPLIHHEFAGLVRIEKNIEAASDYFISNQISGYLEMVTTLKLTVKKDQRENLAKNHLDQKEKLKAIEGIWKLVSCDLVKIRLWDDSERVEHKKEFLNFVREKTTNDTQATLFITGGFATLIMGTKGDVCQSSESGAIVFGNQIIEFQGDLTDYQKEISKKLSNVMLFEMKYDNDHTYGGCKMQRQQQVQGSNVEYQPIVIEGNHLQLDRDGFDTCTFKRL